MIKKYNPLKLPIDYSEMESYIESNKRQLTEQVLTGIQYAFDHNLSSIEVFEFVKSDFIVIIEKSSFTENIENIYNFYIDTEQYEFCERALKLKKLIQTNEKEKRHKS